MGLLRLDRACSSKPAPSAARWLEVFYYIDPVPTSFIAAAMPQFHCDYTAPHSTCQQIKVTN